MPPLPAPRLVAGTPQRNSAVFQSDSSIGSSVDIAMEGTLLKRGRRVRKHWNERYFTLSDSTLSYTLSKQDSQIRGSFSITNGKCSIGSLYMDQRINGTSKELLYCIRIDFDDDQVDPHNLTVTSSDHDAPSTPAPNMQSTSTLQNTSLEEDEEGEHSERKRLQFRRGRSSKKKVTETPNAEAVADPHQSQTPGRLSPKRRSLVPPSQPGDGEGGPCLPSLLDEGTGEFHVSASRSYFQEQQLHEQQRMHTHYKEAQKQHKKEVRKKIADGSKWAAAAGAAVAVGILTAGVGLMAGLVFLGAGAAAGGTGVVGGAAYHTMKKKAQLVIASGSYAEARRWKAALDACLVSEKIGDSTWGQRFVMDGRSAKTALLPTELHANRSGELSEGEMSPRGVTGHFDDGNAVVDPGAQWQPVEEGYYTLLGCSGLRVFREERHASHQSRLSVKESACLPLKAQIVLTASALEAFFCLMSFARVPSNGRTQPTSGQRASFRVVERMDDNTDIIHLFFRPIFLLPSWTSPRDYCLYRYWRYDPDGSYVICFDSVKHDKCPPHPEYTRGDMHGVYNIAPRKRTRPGMEGIGEECLLTCVVQVDPRGWIPRSFLYGYSESFGISALLQMLDIKDALDHERFVPVHVDNTTSLSTQRRHATYQLHSEEDPINYDFNYASQEDHNPAEKSSSIASFPPPLPHHKWAQPDANSFRVRGKDYKTDKVKINAGSSIGRLFAVDVVRVDEPFYSGLSLHPTERIQLALERERRLLAKGSPSDIPPFVFLVNIILPGPPFYHGAFYYAVDDMSCINGTDGTPSSKLAQRFFFGNDDRFRDRTFKLIPTIVEGNFVVKKAVGSTPAIMGTKLAQRYVQNDRFFEVILDCGSSSVATGVIRLSLGYAKTLVVDMGFLLEGDTEEYLPERIFGCVRMKHPYFGTLLRKVEPVVTEG
ncbi:DUF1336-containing protein [Fragilaria crotonensis]|nr:DUF1336-containing protein [Fragilaria crotonensis]